MEYQRIALADRFRIPPSEVGQRFTAKEVSQIKAFDLIHERLTDDEISELRLKSEAQRVRREL